MFRNHIGPSKTMMLPDQGVVEDGGTVSERTLLNQNLKIKGKTRDC